MLTVASIRFGAVRTSPAPGILRSSGRSLWSYCRRLGRGVVVRFLIACPRACAPDDSSPPRECSAAQQSALAHPSISPGRLLESRAEVPTLGQLRERAGWSRGFRVESGQLGRMQQPHRGTMPNEQGIQSPPIHAPQSYDLYGNWWAHQDSNLGPRYYEIYYRVTALFKSTS